MLISDKCTLFCSFGKQNPDDLSKNISEIIKELEEPLVDGQIFIPLQMLIDDDDADADLDFR
jgi:hypothetical protein